MAIYNSDQVIQNVPGPYHGLGGDLQRLRFTVTLAAAPTTADTINFGIVPAGFRVFDAILKASDMDTGGPTLTLNVGDAALATRLFSASVAAQAGVPDRVCNPVAVDFKYAADTMITGTAGTNATTGAAGTIVLLLDGVFEANPIS